MWWLVLAVLPILLLEFAVFVIIYGIRFEFRLDTDNMSVCLKCYVLDYIETLCIKLFVCEGKFYYQINKKQIKSIEVNTNTDDKAKKKKKKLDKSAYLSKLWSKRPVLKLKQVNVNYGADLEDAKNRAVFDGALMLVSNTLLATNSNKLQINDFQLQNVTEKSQFNGINANCVMGFSLFKIAFFAIYAMLIMGKYKVKA